MDKQQQMNGFDSPKGMVAPTLFLGVGGTGAEIVGRVKNRVDLLRADVDRPDLSFVSYLALDTMPMAGQRATVKACFQEDRFGESLATFRYLGGFNGYEYIRGQYQSRDTQNPDLKSWWDPRIPLDDALIDRGAGRIRAIGRLCLFHNHNDVVHLINNKLTSLFSLKEQQQQGVSSTLTETAPNIVLVCGSAGGSGSGMFLDVSYIAYHLARSIFSVPPKMTAIILLPGLYARRGAGVNQDMADAYQANAAALFQETEYFLQNPAQMDERRLDRVRPAFEALPGAWVPFHHGYMVSEALTGGSLFEELDDLYAYVARALFQLHLTPEDTYGAGVGVNFHKISRKPIPGIGRAPAYSCFGFASIEHPTSIMQGYLEARYALTLLRYGLSTPETGREDALRRQSATDARTWLAQAAKEIYSPLIERLSSLKDTSISKLPNSVFTGEGRLPSADKLPGQLQSARAAADQVVTTVFNDLNKAYEGASPGILDSMRRRVDQLIDTAPNGFYAVNLLLTAADEQLTQTVAQYRVQRDNLRAVSQEALRVLNAGPEVAGSQAAVTARPSDAAARAYVRELQNYAGNKIAEEACRLIIQLLDQICGPPSSVAGVSLEMLAQENAGTDAIFDEARAHVTSIVGMLSMVAMEYQSRVDLKRVSTELGDPRVTTFLPNLSVDDLMAWQGLDEQCAALFSDPRRIEEEMIELTRTWLQQPGMVRPHMREKLDAIKTTIAQALRTRALTLFSCALSVSIEALLAECDDRAQRLRLLRHHASLCCTIKSENLPVEYQQPGTLWSLGAPSDLRAELDIASQSSGHAYMGPRQISLLQSAHGFPAVAVSQMLAPFSIYTRALKPVRGAAPDAPPRFFMHNWADWNRAEGVPLGSGTTSLLSLLDPEATRLFAIGRALASEVTDATLATKISAVVYVDLILVKFGQQPTPDQLGGFIYQQLEDTAGGQAYRYYYRRYHTYESKGQRLYRSGEALPLGFDIVEAFTRFAELLDTTDRQVLTAMYKDIQTRLPEDFTRLCASYGEKLRRRETPAGSLEAEVIIELFRALDSLFGDVPVPGA